MNGRLARVLPPLAASALSAILLWAAFAPADETAAIAFAIAPLLAVSRLCSPGRAALHWFLGGFAFWFATISWMPAISKNGGPLPLVVLGWIGLAALCSGYFALFGWLDARLRSRTVRSRMLLLSAPFLEAFLWAGCEWLRGTLFTGFAWNFLGTALGGVPALALPARFGGVYLVSALVVLVNGVFATLVVRLVEQMKGAEVRRGRWTRMLETALPLAAVLTVVAFAGADFRRAQTTTERIPVRVALAQRNAPCIFARRTGEDPAVAFERVLGVSVYAKVHLAVLAESAFSEFGGVLGGERVGAAARRLSEFLGGAAVLGGGDWRSDGKVYNAAALYSPGDPTPQVYAKRHLVPFGEYIPFDKTFTALQKLSPIGVSCWPGEAKCLDLKLEDAPGGPATVKLAPLICFEDTDPSLSRESAKLGAQAIVLITNDSWFSHSREAEQHAAQAVMRAVECGLPVVRVGNSGVTGVIAESGRARWLGGDGERKALVDAAGTMTDSVLVPRKPAPTLYVRIGDLPMLLAFAFAAMLALGSKLPETFRLLLMPKLW